LWLGKTAAQFGMLGWLDLFRVTAIKLETSAE